MDMFTENGVKINELVYSGMTFFFEKETEANVLAKKKRSYVYPVFDCSGFYKKIIGYAVPK